MIPEVNVFESHMGFGVFTKWIFGYKIGHNLAQNGSKMAHIDRGAEFESGVNFNIILIALGTILVGPMLRLNLPKLTLRTPT